MSFASISSADTARFSLRRMFRGLVGVMSAGVLLALVGVDGDYARFVAELVLINAIAAMGINIGMGFAGLVSVGHAGFAAIGAYGTTILMSRFDLPFLIAMPAGAVIAAIAGVVVGLPALRLSPLYIAMVTFGFGQVVVYVLINWMEVTRGPNGLPVPEATIFGEPLSPVGLYILAVIVFALAAWFQWNIRRTRIGRAFMAVRGSAIAAQSMGIAIARYKTVAFGISAFYGGLSGALYAPISGYVNPDAFTFGVSINYVTMTVVGGIATLSGPIIGAALLTLLPEFLRAFAQYKEVLSGIILLVFIVLLPTGLVGLAQRLCGALRRVAGH